MKYLEIVMVFMMLNLTIGLFSQSGLLPNEVLGETVSESPVNSDGDFY